MVHPDRYPRCVATVVTSAKNCVGGYSGMAPIKDQPTGTTRSVVNFTLKQAMPLMRGVKMLTTTMAVTWS